MQTQSNLYLPWQCIETWQGDLFFFSSKLFVIQKEEGKILILYI